jgi:hypothetical protein
VFEQIYTILCYIFHSVLIKPDATGHNVRRFRGIQYLGMAEDGENIGNGVVAQTLLRQVTKVQMRRQQKQLNRLASDTRTYHF